MTNPTPLQQLVELKLGEDLGEFIAARRKVVVVERPANSWADIAAELKQRTGVTVTRETLRGWGAEDDASAA
jgi:hypothetical protein